MSIVSHRHCALQDGIIRQLFALLSSRHADSMDFFDYLLPSIPIGHCSSKAVQTASSVRTELMNISSCWSVNTGVSMCRSPWMNVTYEFIITSTAVPSMSCSSYLEVLRCETSGCTATVLWNAASRICSKQHTASLWSYQIAFSLSLSLESK